MENKDKIEIPFGAKDSELYECEYTIPEGYEAEIKDGKVIIRKKESEDERIRKEIISMSDTLGRKDWIAWLEKQGEQKPNPCENCSIATNNCQKFPCAIRNGKQKPAEWSEDYERYISYILTNCMHYAEETGYVEEKNNSIIHQQAKDWLKSLKDRVQSQPKQEWSEEDERIRTETIELLETANHPNKMHSNGKPLDFTENINWLKSLRPQNTWKPSDEQMDAFEHYVRSIGESGYASPYDNNTKLLYSLLSDLKKLMEE